MEQKKCPYCGSKNIVYNYETGEIICNDCGAVIGNIMETGPEWRVFESSDLITKRRTGPIYKGTRISGPETMMERSYRDAFGKKLSPTQRLEAGRTRGMELRNPYYHQDRHYRYAMGTIRKYVEELNLPNYIIDIAADMYRKIKSQNAMRGRSIETTLAAVIYLACVQQSIPITIDRMANTLFSSKKAKKEISRVSKIIRKILNLPPKILSADDFVVSIVQRLELGDKVLRLSKMILEEARKKGLVGGRSPAGLAAAVIYIACRELNVKRTQKEIAETANITEVTIRNRYKELTEKLNIEEIVERFKKEYENKE